MDNKKYISIEDAIKTTWMILDGLGYAFDENPQLTEAVLAVFDTAQTADVRPVVRGHWITEEEAAEKGDYSLRDVCSVCGHCDWDCTESASFNFCPNCGTMMEES